MLFNLPETIGIGDSKKNNGVLFLIATEDRKMRIEVGNGLQGAIPDGKAGRILDNYVVSYLQNNDWDNGIKNGFNAILEEVCQEYNIEIDGSIAAVSDSIELSEGESAAFGVSILVLIISIIARFKIKNSKNKLLFGGGTLTLATALQCVLAGSAALFGMYVFINFILIIMALFGHASGGGYYGGGYHGGGYRRMSVDGGSHGGGGHFSGGRS